MRRSVAIFITVNAVLAFFILHSIWTLLSLLVVDGSADAIDPADIPSDISWKLPPGEPHLIPKIIHQTYKNESIPDHWIQPRQSCIDLHPDYEYKLWTDALARELIAEKYPWFLPTWDNYPYNIQRADAIRYFVLLTYGGIYIDLDDGCNRPLDPLLKYPAWLRRTTPTGISNDAMGAIPQHPFFLRAVRSLPKYNRTWFLPYITIMASTGPLYLSIIWRHHNSQFPAPSGLDRVRVLFPNEYMHTDRSFFTHNLGNSWHEKDVQIILWLRDHWLAVTLLNSVIILGFVYCFFLCLNRTFPAATISSPRQNKFNRRFPRWLFPSSPDRIAYSPLSDRRDV